MRYDMKSHLKTLPDLPSLPRILLAATVAAVFALLSAHTFADAISVRYVSGAEVPITSDAFDATGKSLDLALNFVPGADQNLTVVRNTGPEFIKGKFSNLLHGQIVALPYGGVSYHFVANYYGGQGRDLVLMRIRLDDLSAAAREKFNDPLLLALKKSRGEPPFDRSTTLRPEDHEKGGRVLVDIAASVSPDLSNQIAQLGGEPIKSSQTATTMRAWVPFAQLESIANLPAIKSMSAATLTLTRHLAP